MSASSEHPATSGIGPPAQLAALASVVTHVRPDTITDDAVSLPNPPAFEEAVAYRDANLPPSSAAASAVTIVRGAAFWELGFPFWSEKEFYYLVLSELSPMGTYLLMRTELSSIMDLMELLTIIEPGHSLMTIWKVANESW